MLSPSSTSDASQKSPSKAATSPTSPSAATTTPSTAASPRTAAATAGATPSSPSTSAGASPLTASFDKLLVNPTAAAGAKTETLSVPSAQAAVGSNASEGAANPFYQRQAIRTRRVKRQQGSSRFINEQYKELEALPPIKGKLKNMG